MRMDPTAEVTAEALIARLSAEELAQVLRDYGEERQARRLARAIKEAHARGALRSTRDLADVVSAASKGRPLAIHPATRVFQALRIAVNDELAALHRFLEDFVSLLRPGGRAVVISFHSLEDRAVKQRFAHLADPCLCPPSLPLCACGQRPAVRLVFKRVVRPTDDEIARNPRARSARLRAAERI
jgi:16S rRNA (cytosine1402-N4)-methyltransferase